MPCAHPIPAVRGLFGGRPVLGEREVRAFEDRADDVLAAARLLFLPCGTCVGCQLSRARDWAIRCSLELPRHPTASFITLTYSDRYVPVTLQRWHYAGFIKRLRSRLSYPIRHFGCGEYGETTSRPHYHALLFGTDAEDEVRKAWRSGWVTVSEVTPARVSYTAGYCLKKVGYLDRKEVRVDRETGEEYVFQPPFVQMSRRPGIAGAARQFRQSWRSYAMHAGRKVPVPRFLHSSWKESASESELAQLELEKLESRMVRTIRELDAHEAIGASRVRLTLERRYAL